MNRSLAIAAASAVLLGSTISIARAADVPNTPENRAREAAKQGPDALRHFIQRTRMIYGLYYYDFADANKK